LSSAVSIDTGDGAVAPGAAAAARALSTPGSTSGATLALSRATRAPARTRWWVEVGVIVWLCWVYDAITNFAPLRLSAALSHARGVLQLERTLHIDPELTLDRWLAGHHTLGLALSDYYDNAHFIVTLGLLGYLWWRRTDLYRPLRNALVLVNVLGFVVFWLYPVAPPRMLTAAGFTDVVAATHAFGSWHTGALASHANQLAAMPSLHMAWAAWCALALWRISERRWVRALALLYPCMTTLAVLATGNHFVLDILGGLVAMAVAVLAAGAVERLRSRRGLRTRRGEPWRAPRGGRVRSGARRRRARRFLPNSDHPADRPAYHVSQACYEVQDQVD
jgi:membrane-associated phospholipid phosphatase